jgi:hypothetical protein
MQKYRLFRLLIGLIIIFIYSAQGQESDPYQLYLSGQFSTLEQLITNDQISSPDWKEFTKALFQEDFNEALKQFINIYKHTSDNRLKKVIIDRVSQYYYAKGLYDSAERILKDEGFRNQIFSVETDKIYFGVQLGAFSAQENAVKARANYLKKLSEVTIIKKTSGGKLLYTVVAGRFEKKESAENYKAQIKEKYGYKGITVQF